MAEQVISGANNDVDVVAVYGGGSILMREALEKRLAAFCGRAKIALAYIDDPDDAVFLEAEGLNAFICSPLFQLLKEKGCDRSGEQTAKTGTFKEAVDRDKRADECGFGKYGCRA